MYLYGGHVTRFEKRGEPPLLFLSEKSLFTRGKAIRGGIPLIFPWFGAHATDSKKPQHGFARTSEWTVVASTADRIVLRLEVESIVSTLTVAIGDRLALTFEVENKSAEDFRFEAALHTYLTVGDVRQVQVTGLEGTTYIDKTDGFKRKQQDGPVKIEKETDSVYINTPATCVLEDPVLKRRITVEKTGSLSTVIWNPHVEKAKAFADFGDDEWQRMICIETCNAADNAVTLAPGARHVMTAAISSSAG